MRTRTIRRRPRARTAGPASTPTGRLTQLWQRFEHQSNAADAVYETLREAILSGVLAPGSRLGEIQLAGVFSRSRTPIREAMFRLESERLAERLPRRGLVVAGIGREEILNVYTVRAVLDGLAARLAAQAILPMDLEQLKWLNQRLHRVAEQGDFASMVGLNIEFHETICRASRNALLLQFTRQIHDWVRRFTDTTFSHPGRAAEALREHDELLAALERRDPDEAERIARRHMASARQVRVAMLQSSAETDGETELTGETAAEDREAR